MTSYNKLISFLTRRERRSLYTLLAMMLVMGLLDAAGVASILPFLTVVAAPDLIINDPRLAAIYRTLGFTDSQSFLIFLGACSLVLVIFGQAFHAFTMYRLQHFARLREYSISTRLLNTYLRRPYIWHVSRHSADLSKSVLSEVEKVVAAGLVPAMRGLAQLVVILSIVSVVVFIEPGVAIATMLFVGGPYAAIYAFSRHYLRRIGFDRLQANRERYQISQEAFGAIKDIKVKALEESFLTRFKGPAARYASHQATAAIFAEMPRYLLEGTTFGAMILLLLFLLITSDGQIASIIPVMGLFAFAGVRLFPAFQQIFTAVTTLRFNQPIIETLYRDLVEAGEPEKSGRRKSGSQAVTVELRDRIQLENLTYVYPGSSRPAIQRLSLVIPAKTTVALVGTTGAGKTTVVDVILGLLEAQSGSLRVDGAAIDRANVCSWQRRLGYVPQHIFLADDSIAANIAFGVDQDAVDMAAVERAARIAKLHAFISSELPTGYATRVGERGVRLSGGQRQRIGIARALYHDPDVLILDEATSALDNLTERAVMDAVHDLGRRKTIIMIAHRLTTVQACDQIFFLEDGALIAQGDYASLVSSNSLFRNMSTVAAY